MLAGSIAGLIHIFIYITARKLLHRRLGGRGGGYWELYSQPRLSRSLDSGREFYLFALVLLGCDYIKLFLCEPFSLKRKKMARLNAGSLREIKLTAWAKKGLLGKK